MPMMEFYFAPQDFNPREKFLLKPFKYSEISLSPSEKRLLRKHGTVLFAFSDGTLTPVTPRQKHFVAVCQMEAEPETEEERVWIKYVSILSDEKRLEALNREELKQSPKREEYLQSRYKS